MKHVGPMNLLVPMENAFSNVGDAIVTMIAVMVAMNRTVQCKNVIANMIFDVAMVFASPTNGNVMENQIARMAPMNWYV